MGHGGQTRLSEKDEAKPARAGGGELKERGAGTDADLDAVLAVNLGQLDDLVDATRT